MGDNKSLNISLTYRKFYPHIQEHFGSEKVALLVGALEYWFSKEKFRYGFFKFFEPCPHRLCKGGDTWAEELGWKRDLFKRIFDGIGTRYNSKTAYIRAAERGDPFLGKLYACYYDRKTNRTFFIRNHTFVDALLHTLNLSFSTKSPAYKKSQKNGAGERAQTLSTKTPPQEGSDWKKSFQNQDQDASLTQYSTEEKTQSPIDTKINTYKNSSKKPDGVSHKKDGQEEDFLKDMIKIWEKTVCPMESWVKTQGFFKRMKESLLTCFEGSLEKWQTYCHKIASSKFLMGEGTSSFKAWIQWAIKPETVARVLHGGFTFGDRPLSEDISIKQQKSAQQQRLNQAFESMEEDDKNAYLPSFIKDLWSKNPAMATAISQYGLRDSFHQTSFKAFVLGKIDSQEKALPC